MNRSYLKFALIFSVVILIVGGGYLVWDRYFSEIGKARRFTEEQMRVYEKSEKAYVEAMTADTYGGRTPQETLELFIVALEKSDVDLASKYFLLDENLSREKWAKQLQDIKNRSLLDKMIRDLNTAEFYDSLYEGNQQFVIYNENKTGSLLVNFFFNKYSKVWKIESL